MKTPLRSLALVSAFTALNPVYSPAAEGTASAPVQKATPAPATPPKKSGGLPKLNYIKPPGAKGVPAMRQSGGTRGSGDAKLPTLYVLSPDHVALTTQAQPTLFWYQSEPAKAAFEITLIEAKKAQPLLSLKIDDAKAAGIRALSLARHRVTLTPNVVYKWNVALIPDPANRSKDLIATGVIKRIEPPANLRDTATTAAPAERAALYAQAGLWYDALQAISTAMAAEPKNADLRKMRASLLDQAKLPEAAAVDRR